MKIISKFKDYYDYLIGVYGIDEKIILDRTKYSTILYKPLNYSSILFYIGGYIINGIYIDNTFIYGEALLQYNDTSVYYFKDKKFYYIKVPDSRHNYIRIHKNIIKDDADINVKLNYPILVESIAGITGEFIYHNNIKYFINPILKDYGIASILKAEDIYIKLCNFLSRDIFNEIKLTDKQKIISHGFDNITSFRK